MNTNRHLTLTLATTFAVAACGASLRAAETNAFTRIGVYDSRAVACAWFWGAQHQKELNELMQTARAAKNAGDTNRFAELSAALRQQQDEMHREGFSTAPATNAMAEIKSRLRAIQKAAGVSAVFSKWDEAALKQHPRAERIDLTDTLVREFMTPTEKQQKTLSEMQKSIPLSWKQCDELIRKGEI